MKYDVARSLKKSPRRNLSESIPDSASVSLICRLRSSDTELSIGLMRRSLDPSDRWSGQVAFPGGRKDHQDQDDLATAIRETLEEVGVHLRHEDHVGSLDDIQARRAGAWLPFFLRPHVFFIDQDPKIILNSAEASDFNWFPLSYFADPKNFTQINVQEPTQTVNLPAVHIPGGAPLWGLTFLILKDFLQRLSQSPDLHLELPAFWENSAAQYSQKASK
jgi:8-oxo-dGTP pyrophosphatase MutT (NUDIX family)